MKKTKLFALLTALTLMIAACDNAPDNPDDPNGNGNGDGNTEVGDGTKEKPYTVADIITMNPSSTTEPVKSDVWMTGFIVGYYNSTPNPSIMETEAPFTDNVNIMMAATEGETDMTKCVSVQLPTDNVRTVLGLKDNPDNIQKEIMVYGDVLKYNTFPGIKNTEAYWFVTEDTGIDPPEGDFDVEEMSIADVRALWSGTAEQITEKKKITGVVISDLEGGNSASLKNLIITSEDNSIGLMLRVAESSHSYNMGDKIEINVEGVELAAYGEALQLNNLPLVKTRKISTAQITPKVMSVADVITNYNTLESSLVTVTGAITSGGEGKWYSGTATGQNNILSKDGSELIMYITKYATFKDETIPSGEKTVTGIVGRFNDTYQLIIRNENDVQ